MRTIVGFIFGVAATIGVAYFHDFTTTVPSEKIVNWDQAGAFARAIVDTARQQIERLTGK